MFLKEFFVVSEWSNQLFQSEGQSEGLLFCAFIIQENVAKVFKQICPFCSGLLDFSPIVFDERVDESNDL